MITYYKRWTTYASNVICIGDDGCPVCKTFSELSRPKKKFMVNVLDKADGTMKTMSLSESAYRQMAEKFEPKTRYQKFKQKMSDLKFETKHWRYHVYMLGQRIKGLFGGASRGRV